MLVILSVIAFNVNTFCCFCYYLLLLQFCYYYCCYCCYYFTFFTCFSLLFLFVLFYFINSFFDYLFIFLLFGYGLCCPRQFPRFLAFPMWVRPWGPSLRRDPDASSIYLLFSFVVPCFVDA